MQRIVPNLWYDGAAEEAARRYVELIPGSRLGAVTRYGKAGREIHGQAEGSVMTQDFELAGTRVTALNGGPLFRFTPAISFFVTLDRREDVDRAWAGLAEGGEALMPLDAYPWSPRYGWVADRWGMTWQIAQGDPAASGRAVAPLLMFTGAQAGRAESAIEEYVSLFAGSAITGVARYDGSGPDAAGTVMHAQFTLGGETFMAFDSAGQHDFGFGEAVSLAVPRSGSLAGLTLAMSIWARTSREKRLVGRLRRWTAAAGTPSGSMTSIIAGERPSTRGSAGPECQTQRWTLRSASEVGLPSG